MNFLSVEKEALELFKRLASEVLELEWICNNGLIAAAVTEDIMYWMVKSGLKAFKVGIESGNDKVLTKIKKPTTKDKLWRAGVLFKKYSDVFASGNFILGFPQETFGEMLDTYNFANELNWDWVSYYLCQPLKGTEMFSAFQALGDERCDYENYDKTLNLGRSAARGEFGHHKAYHSQSVQHEVILTGCDIFNLDKNLVPSKEQVKEIWFTFNMITNFIQNPIFLPSGNPSKIVRWFEAISGAYP